MDEVCLLFQIQQTNNDDDFSFVDTVPNPCLASTSNVEQYYPFAFSAHAYVQCNGDILYVRPCSAGLYWNQETKVCDNIETSPAPPSAKDLTQSYQVTYGTEQPPQQAYTRPIASFADQSFTKPYQAPSINLIPQR